MLELLQLHYEFDLQQLMILEDSGLLELIYNYKTC